MSHSFPSLSLSLALSPPFGSLFSCFKHTIAFNCAPLTSSTPQDLEYSSPSFLSARHTTTTNTHKRERERQRSNNNSEESGVLAASSQQHERTFPIIFSHEMKLFYLFLPFRDRIIILAPHTRHARFSCASRERMRQ